MNTFALLRAFIMFPFVQIYFVFNLLVLMFSCLHFFFSSVALPVCAQKRRNKLKLGL